MKTNIFLFSSLLVGFLTLWSFSSQAQSTDQTQENNQFSTTFETRTGYPVTPGSGDALEFDGVSDLVSTLGNSNLNPDINSLSVSFWIYVNSATGSFQYAFSKYGNGGINGGLGGFEEDGYGVNIINGGFVSFQLRDEFGNFQACVSEMSIQDFQWHHVSVIVDRTNNLAKIYIDGSLDKSEDLDIVGEISPGNPITIGAEENFGAQGHKAYFNGTIDEMRIWNEVALTQQEIRDYMCQKDLSTHPQIDHLAAYYRFDDGTGSSVLEDLSGNGNNGTLINMNPDSSWVTSGAPIGDISAQSYVDSELTLTSLTSFTADNFTGDPEGVHIYKVNEAPNDQTIPASFSSLETSEYYGVHIVGGSNPTYRGVYNYGANLNVEGQANEASVLLADRANNAAGAFESTTNQALNTTANTIVAENQSGTEYIIGFGDFDCPLIGSNIGDPCDDNNPNTINDQINANCDCVGEFVCANPFPPVEEISLNTTFQGNGYLLEWNPVPNQIGCQVMVRLAGGGLLGQRIVGGANAQSFYLPGGVLQLGTDYAWRVRCGCSQSPTVTGPWSTWQPFTTPGGASITSSPNPTEGHSFVSFTAVEETYATLEVFDLSGRLVESIFTGAVQPDVEYRFEFDGSALPNGVYLYRLTTNEEVVTEKFMIAK